MMFIGSVARSMLAVVVLFATASLAAAQGVGAINGTVVDEMGAVIPGATVTLSNNEGTLGGNQETVSDTRGAYEFPRLVPGTYAVRAQLAGFRQTEQRGIVVRSDLTARADLKLVVGALEEAITVTGGAPILDTTTAQKVTAISREELESLPNRTDVWSIARVIPGVVIGKIDVGGTEAFEASTATVRGSGNENKFMVDGMDVSSISGTGVIANFYLDPYAYQETSFQVGGGSAENANGGLNFNMITRTGTNAFHGGAKINGTTPALSRSRNYSPELRTQLLANVPARVLAANPDLQPNADIRLMSDAGGWLAGPIVRDKLWFASTWHDQRLDRYRLGSYDPDGAPVIDDNVLWNLTTKISWQVARTAQLSYFINRQYKLIGHRGGGTFADSRARNYNYKYPTVNQAKYTMPIRNSMALDVTFGDFRSDDTFVPRPEVTPGDVATFDTTTQVSNIALPVYSDNWMSRDQLRASLTFSKGRHDAKAGFEFIRNDRKNRTWSLSGMRAQFANGVPASVNTYLVPLTGERTLDIPSDVPVLFQYRADETGAFIQDRWAPHRKLTLNVGLRFGTNRSWQPASCAPETQFYPGQCFDKITAPSFGDFSPRFNMVYDLMGDGRTALKFSANRYLLPLSVSVIERLNPITTPNDTRQWLPQSRCNEAGVLGCDRNGDLIPQLTEIGPTPGYVFEGVNAFYQDGLKRPVANDYAVELQRELGQGMVVSVAYAVRQTRDNIGSRNMAAPPESWIGPLTVTEVTSGQTVQVWNRGTAASNNLFYNSSDFNTDYRGWDLTFNKRMRNHWSAQGGANFSRVTQATRGGNRNDPNITQNFDGEMPTTGNRPWSYRVSGAFELPYAFFSSATWQFQAGPPETTSVLVTNQTRPLAQGNQTVLMRPVGDVSYPNTAELDFNLWRTFAFGKTRVIPRFEVFNLTNQATITDWVTQLGPTYHRPSGLQRGRLYKLEMALDF